MPRLPIPVICWWTLLLLLTFGEVAYSGEKPRSGDASDDQQLVRWKQPWHWSSQGGLICTAQGRILATGGTEKGIALWELPSGKRIRSWEAPRGSYSWQIKLSANGKVLAGAGGKDQRVIQICEVDSGKIRKAWTAPEYLLAIDLSADGKLAASMSNQGNIHIWDTIDGKQRAMFQGWSAVFGKDGTTVVVGSHKSVGIWDLETRKELRRLEGTATSLAISADGKLLAGAGANGIHLWDLAAGRLTRTITTDMGVHRSTVRISRNGRTVALTNDELIAAWDTDTGKIRFQIPGNWWYMASALSPDGRSLYYSDGSEVVRQSLGAIPRP
jgi:WD40 repeat protein